MKGVGNRGRYLWGGFGHILRRLRRLKKMSDYSSKSNLPERLLTLRPKLPLKQRLKWFLTHPPSLKQVGWFSMGIVVISGAILIVRLLLTANKIIVHDQGAAALSDEVDPSLLKGEGDGRVNVLLIGIGGEGHTGGDLSDSIMLASLDPISKDLTLLSIPRDLYLEIGNFGSNKINAAHAYGEQYDYPGGGPKLLSQTVAKALGVPVHYYLRLDFDGFKQAIDTVDGVDVEVKEAIYDYSYPNEDSSGYQAFKVAAGLQHMSGSLALKYARSRYTTSDFDRARRQQQILTAFKDKALTLGTLANPFRLNSLLSSAGNHVKTDLRVDEMLKLYRLGKETRPEQISQAVLDNSPENYLASQNINGLSALVPRSGDWVAIRRYVRSLMIDGYIKREGARINILNGTGRPGRGEATAKILRSYGYQIGKIANADNSNYTQSKIYDHSHGAKRYTLHYLGRRFGVGIEARDADPMAPADITIIIGSDYDLAE